MTIDTGEAASQFSSRAAAVAIEIGFNSLAELDQVRWFCGTPRVMAPLVIWRGLFFGAAMARTGSAAAPENQGQAAYFLQQNQRLDLALTL